MTELLERLEGLDGPCRYTDALIAVAVGFDLKVGHDLSKLITPYEECELVGMMSSPTWAFSKIPEYTSSTDDSLAIIPDGYSVLMVINPNKTLINLNVGGLGNPKTAWLALVEAKTAPLAVCVAAIKARQNSTNNVGEA